MSTDVKPLRKVGVKIFERQPVYAQPGKTFDRLVMSFAEMTMVEAQAEAAKHVAWVEERSGRPHVATYHGFCGTCKLTGIEPGRRVKKCSTCGGSGCIAAPSEETR